MHDSTSTKPQTPLRRGHSPHLWGLAPIGVGWLLWGLLKTESLHLPLGTAP